MIVFGVYETDMKVEMGSYGAFLQGLEREYRDAVATMKRMIVDGVF